MRIPGRVTITKVFMGVMVNGNSDVLFTRGRRVLYPERDAVSNHHKLHLPGFVGNVGDLNGPLSPTESYLETGARLVANASHGSLRKRRRLSRTKTLRNERGSARLTALEAIR
jgi:hypothetical protein